MIKSVTTINEYDGFINSFLDNSKFSDPHLTARIEAGEKVIKASDRFKTFVAIEDGTVTGYIDVTHCFAENEPYDILVKEEYRRKGYGRQLLVKTLQENEPKDMMLLVDFDNEPAINLYESLGFIKKESGNLLTAYWKVPDDKAVAELYELIRDRIGAISGSPEQ